MSVSPKPGVTLGDLLARKQALVDGYLFTTMSGSTYQIDLLDDGSETCTVTRRHPHHTLPARERFTVVWRTQVVEGASVRMEDLRGRSLMTTPVTHMEVLRTVFGQRLAEWSDGLDGQVRILE